jgi:hypothetical protein
MSLKPSYLAVWIWAKIIGVWIESRSRFNRFQENGWSLVASQTGR